MMPLYSSGDSVFPVFNSITPLGTPGSIEPPKLLQGGQNNSEA